MFSALGSLHSLGRPRHLNDFSFWLDEEHFLLQPQPRKVRLHKVGILAKEAAVYGLHDLKQPHHHNNFL